jgi:hypothetical protein
LRNVRRGTITNYLIVAAVGVVVAVAAADALRSRPSSTPTRAPTTTSDSQESVFPAPTQREKVEQTGNRWAALFAAGKNSCADMSQPLCERIACERVGGRKIRNCRPPTLAFRKSFDRAVVREVGFKKNRAAARFSNGEIVEFWGDGGGYMVIKIGGNAGRGFFD